MKEHPILFSAPMVRAILDGSKSQTRRIVSTDFSCCDFGTCNQGMGCPAGSIVAQDLLGTDPLPGLMTYDDAKKQWITRPLYKHLRTENSDGSDPDADTDDTLLRPARVLIGAGVFLASVVGISMAVLYFFRG